MCLAPARAVKGMGVLSILPALFALDNGIALANHAAAFSTRKSRFVRCVSKRAAVGGSKQEENFFLMHKLRRRAPSVSANGPKQELMTSFGRKEL
jgi:hypothetical protein